MESFNLTNENWSVSHGVTNELFDALVRLDHSSTTYIQTSRSYFALSTRKKNNVQGSFCQYKMDEELSISLVIILVIGGIMITALLTCYACIFRDLCCQRVDRAKRRRGRRSLGGGSGDIARARNDVIQLNDITQGESMPTESEKV